jgi:hypothetical protein
MKTKVCTIAFLLLIGFKSHSQTSSIVGKWKPISFSLGNMLDGDLTKSEPDVKISIDSLVKGDKDPEGSKEMMKMIFQMVFDKTKVIIEEYKANGDYIETNTKTGKIKEGKYIFDDKRGTLIKSYNNSSAKIIYRININKNELTQKSDLETGIGEKPAELIVIYTKLVKQ